MAPVHGLNKKTAAFNVSATTEMSYEYQEYSSYDGQEDYQEYPGFGNDTQYFEYGGGEDGDFDYSGIDYGETEYGGFNYQEGEYWNGEYGGEEYEGPDYGGNDGDYGEYGNYGEYENNGEDGDYGEYPNFEDNENYEEYGNNEYEESRDECAADYSTEYNEDLQNLPENESRQYNCYLMTKAQKLYVFFVPVAFNCILGLPLHLMLLFYIFWKSGKLYNYQKVLAFQSINDIVYILADTLYYTLTTFDVFLQQPGTTLLNVLHLIKQICADIALFVVSATAVYWKTKFSSTKLVDGLMFLLVILVFVAKTTLDTIKNISNIQHNTTEILEGNSSTTISIFADDGVIPTTIQYAYIVGLALVNLVCIVALRNANGEKFSEKVVYTQKKMSIALLVKTMIYIIDRSCLPFINLMKETVIANDYMGPDFYVYFGNFLKDFRYMTFASYPFIDAVLNWWCIYGLFKEKKEVNKLMKGLVESENRKQPIEMNTY